jgi:hypothetical protein
LTLKQHLHDEDPELRKVCTHFEINPPWAWYYCISPNYRTLVILLQVDPISGDELEIVCASCYETEDASIFAWSSILNIGHYCWLRSSICRLPPNCKVNYLVCTIWYILNFLQLWTIIAA